MNKYNIIYSETLANFRPSSIRTGRKFSGRLARRLRETPWMATRSALAATTFFEPSRCPGVEFYRRAQNPLRRLLPRLQHSSSPPQIYSYCGGGGGFQGSALYPSGQRPTHHPAIRHAVRGPAALLGAVVPSALRQTS